MESELLVLRAKRLGDGRVFYIPLSEIVQYDGINTVCTFTTRQDRRYECWATNGSQSFAAALCRIPLTPEGGHE